MSFLSRHATRSFLHMRHSLHPTVPAPALLLKEVYRIPLYTTSHRQPRSKSTMSPSSSPSASANAADNFNLDRFVRFQDTRRNYDAALAEIRMGRKESHWIWFVFPQISGLGAFPSDMAQHFAIGSLAEAQAYLAHPVLGPRLREISQAVLESEVEDVGELMGSSVDRQKLRSSMTLFKRVVDGIGGEDRSEGDGVFEGVLEKYYDGEEDEETVKRLRRVKS
ncbi:DUF1810-domain-containing protein [Coniochaeta ligniaria NRRL 30616]|uniref:DUF1810-domain-containing protein n=1 Tax=Coniochaeta ligniaria NRRL 30616 TaxID=1408157 RepID=A0A1J7IWA7_9PEZI|nr:DUF1810-domain-containing protein [Coniochaeta ligniaria NRRL 30616]